MAVDQAKLEEFLGRFVTDFGATMHAATVVIGDKLGLYRALTAVGPTDRAGLAAHTGHDRRLVEEWLQAQYVSGYCEHDPTAGTFWLNEAGGRARGRGQPGARRRRNDHRRVALQGRGTPPRAVHHRPVRLGRAPPRPVRRH